MDELDRWLRGRGADLDTELEEAYFAAGVEFLAEPGLEPAKQALLTEGAALAGAVDVDAVPADPALRYELLGMVGFVFAICRRHEVEDPTLLAPAWRVAERLGAELGVVPRFTFAHQSLANTAIRGRLRTFTTLEEEHAFVVRNGQAVLAYERAAAALRPVAAMGVTSPIVGPQLDAARVALDDVLAADQAISREVSVERFFRSIRPYFKTHRVGAGEFRGANAGDFSAINELDVLLGCVDPAEPSYAWVVEEKLPYVPPADQPRLRRLSAADSLLARFEAEAPPGAVPGEAWRDNARRFLAVCRAHAAAATYHHTALVRPFLEKPAAAMPVDRAASVSASGPPLSEVVAALDRLRVARSDRSRLARVAALVAEG
ncbi:MAG: DUF1864 family protein [Chloroflexota bacterium]